MRALFTVFSLSLILLVNGCVSLGSRIADNDFRDYLNFEDICLHEKNWKPEICASLWHEWVESRHRIGPPQHTSIHLTTFAAPTSSGDGYNAASSLRFQAIANSAPDPAYFVPGTGGNDVVPENVGE